MALTDSKIARWCDGLIEAGWLVAVISAPLFFNIHSDRVFEPDKLTLIRSIAVLMVAAWLVKFIDLRGWQSWKRLRWRDDSSLWRMPFVLPVFILVVVYLISTAISVTPRISWAGSYQRLQGTYTTLAYIVVFSLMIATMRTRAQVRRLVTVVIITSIPIAFYGLLQHFELDPLPWGGNTQKRVAGHMGNAIFIAAYLIMAVPLTVARIIDAFTSILGDEELAYADVIRSSIYIFTLAIQLIAIYWSGSRGPWIGLAVAVFAFILIVLVTLRDAAEESKSSRLIDGLRALVLVAVGTSGVYMLATVIINAITNTGRAQSLAGPMGSFVAFAAAIGLVVLAIFIMIAARRGWRWLWLSWLFLTVLGAGWLAAFNFAETLQDPLDKTPVLGPMADALVEWRDLPAIGRLGRLLESDSGTGKVRVLIWDGALDLLNIHEPLRFPNGEKDNFNFLRPLFGYGPESMYVAYNRFYPPELATLEARNASPDRSHNETFDALVITGGLGLLTWQALYLSVFYYGFRWLGVVRSRRDTYLLIGFWIIGALMASILVTQAMGLEFLGVAIPLGSILGLVAYLVFYALSARTVAPEGEESDPFHVDRLLMIGLVAAVLAHYVEIHFGIAIASTRTHFFAYIGLIFIVGYWLPRQKEMEDTPFPVKGRKRRVLRGRTRTAGGSWAPVLLYALVLAFILATLGYEFTTYSLPPDKLIESPADLSASEIFRQSFLINASKEFVDSPFVYLMVLLTWALGVLAVVSEMVKSGELRFEATSGRVKPGRLQIAAVIYGVMFIAAIVMRFLVPRPTVPSTSMLLGRSLLLIWSGLSIWAATRLVTEYPSARLLGGAVAFAGLIFSLPILLAGAGVAALIIAVACGFLLYLLWDRAWQKALVPSAVLAFIALAIGLLYAFIQASTLRASLFFQNADPAATVEQLRVSEAEQASSFLILFYVFTISLMLLAAFASSWNSMGSVRNSGSMSAYFSIFVLFILAFVVINQTNMRIIQADVIYKRAKPFDNSATRSRDPEQWNVAVAIYERAVELVPKEDFYYLFLGRAYLEQSTVTGDLEKQADLLKEAEERLIDAQNINPLNTDHTANLARLNTRWVQLSKEESDRQERLETADNYYQDALALSPQNSIIRNEYGRLAFDLKRDCDEAFDIFDESIEIDPFYEATYFGLGEIYIACATGTEGGERQEYFSNAVTSFEEGLAIKDRDVRVWLQLAQAYHELDEYDQALTAYQESKARNNNNQIPDWNIDFWMATVQLDKGDEAAAEDLARQAMAIAPAEAAGQIQAFLSQFVDGPITLPPQTAEVPVGGDRPLAILPPIQRNGYFPTQPPFVIDPSRDYEAVLLTEKGEMRIRLFDDASPLTVNNFVYLANQGFFDGITFHRVIEGFMAQGGDPIGTGTGGPGYTFPDEVNNGLSFDRRGLLAMANAGPDTNGSQFFITFVPTPGLDGRHTIFGELIAGDEVLGSLSFRDPATAATPGDLILRVDIIESSE